MDCANTAYGYQSEGYISAGRDQDAILKLLLRLQMMQPESEATY